MTCNDCGRDIGDCDRHGCREIRGVSWAKPLVESSMSRVQEPDPAERLIAEYNSAVEWHSWHPAPANARKVKAKYDALMAYINELRRPAQTVRDVGE